MPTNKYKTQEERTAARKASALKYYYANKEKCLAAGKDKRASNIIEFREAARARRAANPEKYRAYSRKHRAAKLEATRAYMREWKASNKGKVNAQTAKRYTAKLERTPKWLTKEQLKAIEVYYITAAKLTELTGIRFEVDHIIPLKGKSVSGLHVPWNLQILSQYDNLVKGNRYDGQNV